MPIYRKHFEIQKVRGGFRLMHQPSSVEIRRGNEFFKTEKIAQDCVDRIATLPVDYSSNVALATMDTKTSRQFWSLVYA